MGQSELRQQLQNHSYMMFFFLSLPLLRKELTAGSKARGNRMIGLISCAEVSTRTN